jgi:hypothetical protein
MPLDWKHRCWQPASADAVCRVMLWLGGREHRSGKRGICAAVYEFESTPRVLAMWVCKWSWCEDNAGCYSRYTSYEQKYPWPWSLCVVYLRNNMVPSPKRRLCTQEGMREVLAAGCHGRILFSSR